MQKASLKKFLKSLCAIFIFSVIISLYQSKFRMEEDEELIKKLMNLLGSGREIKFKSPNGQTIKVSLDGNSYNQTEESNERPCIQGQREIKQDHFQQLYEESDENIFEPPEVLEEQNFSECLKEISTDFNALSRIKQKSGPNQSIFNEESLQTMLLLDIQKLNQKQSNSSLKNQDNIFKEIISEIQQPKLAQKPKKISLKNKNKEATNQPVIDFFKQQQQNVFQFNTEFKRQTEHYSFPSSSPVISRVKDDLPVKSNSKSQTIQENINLLKERHPEDERAIEMISQRLHQLQEKSKIMDQSLSLLNSSISNNISIGLQSFQISMLSFKNNSEDPLCYIFSQFINKVKQQAAKNCSKSIPSSFLFMYSQPLVNSKGKEIEQQINYFQEQQIILKTLKEGKCKVDYIHQPATIEKLHYWIKQGIEILHFCGHGIQSKESNYLLFQNERGESVNVVTEKLAQLLSQRVNALKLVFVASCHSQSAGKVFSEAGASHVICIRNEYQILDQACEQFVRLFYLTCINSKTTICESFYFAKKQLQLKGKFTKHQCEKFIIIKDHNKQNCQHFFEHRNEIQNFNDLNPHPCYNKYLLSRVQHYVPRCRDMYQIIKLISQKRRYITIIGQSGIGKSTFVRELVRYLQFRNYFKDGVVYLQLRGCENMSKLFQVLDLQLFQTPQLKLNKSIAENAIRLVRELNQKNLLFIFDNCQNIMASEDKDQFKKFTEHLMKNCKDTVFIFTNRHSIGRQIDYCSEKLYELGRLTYSQSKTLFYKKVPRNIKKKEFQDFFNLDNDNHQNQTNEHSFFNFLNGHPEAICMTASLLADRSLKELYEMLLKPNISEQMNEDINEQYNPKESINRVVSTAIKISLNVIRHKYKDASMMVKMLSLLPNGVDNDMMSRLFPQGGKWKETIKKLINHSLVQCIQKGGFVYYVLHPHIIVEVENQMSQEEKIKYHEKLLEEMVKKIRKIYEHVGTLSPMNARQQEVFLFQEDNFKTVLLRELSFIGEKYPLRKFYENIFKAQFQGLDEEEKNDIGDFKITNAQIIANYQKNKKVKALQSEKNAQKRQAIDIFIVYYLTIFFVLKKVKNTSVETYLNYGLIIAQKKNKYLVFANLCRIKACVLLVQNNTTQAKTFFSTGRVQFAQVGCGLGSACCEAAIGYIKYCQSQYASAKMNLQNALKYYDEIPHPFGKHYLNRWLCSLKAKMNRGEKQLFNHKLQAQKLLKQAKSNLRANNFNNISLIKHKLGVFPFRFLLDNISLFLEATFEIDLRPKFISTVSQYIPHAALNKEKDSKKNNFILDQINQEPPLHSSIGTSSGIVIPRNTVDNVNHKKKQPALAKRLVAKKSEKPDRLFKENNKQYQKTQKTQKEV